MAVYKRGPDPQPDPPIAPGLTAWYDSSMTLHDYRHPLVDSMWTDRSKYVKWTALEVQVLQVVHPELAALRASKVSSMVPAPDLVAEFEAKTGHEMTAFLTVLASRLPSTHARWLHHGLTSSDVQDTCTAMTLKQVNRVIQDQYRLLITGIDRFRGMTTLGFTHGQVASPVTWARRFSSKLCGIGAPVTYYGTMSGATGGYPAFGPDAEQRVLAAFGLVAAPDPSQVVPRRLLTVPSLRYWSDLAQTCYSVAQDIRLGSMLGLCSEPSRLTGSSAMPGKVNPVSSERICALADLVIDGCHSLERSTTRLWFERDLTNSAQEREQLPRLSSLVGFLLKQTTALLANLVVTDVHLDESDWRVWAEALLVEYVIANDSTSYPQAHATVSAALNANANVFEVVAALGLDWFTVGARLHRISSERGMVQ